MGPAGEHELGAQAEQEIQAHYSTSQNKNCVVERFPHLVLMNYQIKELIQSTLRQTRCSVCLGSSFKIPVTNSELARPPPLAANWRLLGSPWDPAGACSQKEPRPSAPLQTAADQAESQQGLDVAVCKFKRSERFFIKRNQVK